ncbi:4604_t:CDS:2, partial [Funneliformis caledonium]
AKQSDKKISQENLRYLKNLKLSFLSVNAVYILYRILLNYSTFTFWLGTGYVITTGITLFLWKQLVNYGTPKYDARGTVVWPGDDLNSEGLTA